MLNAKIEQDQLWSRSGAEKLKEEVAVLEAQLAELEQQYIRSSPLLQKLGRYFSFGAAGKLEWARFKLDFKQEELDRFETRPEIMKVAGNCYGRAPGFQGESFLDGNIQQKVGKYE